MLFRSNVWHIHNYFKKKSKESLNIICRLWNIFLSPNKRRVEKKPLEVERQTWSFVQKERETGAENED